MTGSFVDAPYYGLAAGSSLNSGSVPTWGPFPKSPANAYIAASASLRQTCTSLNGTWTTSLTFFTQGNSTYYSGICTYTAPNPNSTFCFLSNPNAQQKANEIKSDCSSTGADGSAIGVNQVGDYYCVRGICNDCNLLLSGERAANNQFCCSQGKEALNTNAKCSAVLPSNLNYGIEFGAFFWDGERCGVPSLQCGAGPVEVCLANNPEHPDACLCLHPVGHPLRPQNCEDDGGGSSGSGSSSSGSAGSSSSGRLCFATMTELQSVMGSICGSAPSGYNVFAAYANPSYENGMYCVDSYHCACENVFTDAIVDMSFCSLSSSSGSAGGSSSSFDSMCFNNSNEAMSAYNGLIQACQAAGGHDNYDTVNNPGGLICVVGSCDDRPSSSSADGSSSGSSADGSSSGSSSGSSAGSSAGSSSDSGSLPVVPYGQWGAGCKYRCQGFGRVNFGDVSNCPDLGPHDDYIFVVKLPPTNICNYYGIDIVNPDGNACVFSNYCPGVDFVSFPSSGSGFPGSSAGSSAGSSSGSGVRLCRPTRAELEPQLAQDIQACVSAGYTHNYAIVQDGNEWCMFGHCNSPGGDSTGYGSGGGSAGSSGGSSSPGGAAGSSPSGGEGGDPNGNDTTGNGTGCKNLNNCDWAKYEVQLKELGVAQRTLDSLRGLFEWLKYKSHEDSLLLALRWVQDTVRQSRLVQLSETLNGLVFTTWVEHKELMRQQHSQMDSSSDYRTNSIIDAINNLSIRMNSDSAGSGTFNSFLDSWHDMLNNYFGSGSGGGGHGDINVEAPDMSGVADGLSGISKGLAGLDSSFSAGLGKTNSLLHGLDSALWAGNGNILARLDSMTSGSCTSPQCGDGNYDGVGDGVFGGLDTVGLSKSRYDSLLSVGGAGGLRDSADAFASRLRSSTATPWVDGYACPVDELSFDVCDWFGSSCEFSFCKGIFVVKDKHMFEWFGLFFEFVAWVIFFVKIA